jgi:hypothetical protein
MISTITELSSIFDDELKRLKSIQADIRTFESFLKKNEYGKALKLSKEKVRTALCQHYPDKTHLLDKLEAEINDKFRKYRIDFDKDFMSHCETAGLLPVTGNSRSGFRVKGIIEIFIAFENGKSTIGTNSKKVTLPTVDLNSLVQEIRKVHKRLFEREWSAADFLKKLSEAYAVLSRNSFGKEVMLRDVQTQVWMNTQRDSFWKSFDKEKMNEYPTDEFSVDLSKLVSTKDVIQTDITYHLSEGADGITVYDNSGQLRCFKFLTLKKRGQQ